MQPVLHAQRAEVDHPLRQLPHQRSQALHHALGHQRLVAQQGHEGGAVEAGDHAGLQRDHVGRTRAAVDGGDVAEVLAGFGVAEGDLPAICRIGRHPHPARDQQEHLALLLGAQQQGLAGLHAVPQALLGQQAEAGVGQAFEQRDLAQRKAGAGSGFQVWPCRGSMGARALCSGTDSNPFMDRRFPPSPLFFRRDRRHGAICAGRAGWCSWPTSRPTC
jgi:hypothetical protein